jgi:hypothetical protein
MQITIRDRKYTAEHLTDLNYLPIAALWMEEDGVFALSDVGSFESLNEGQKMRLVQPMMKRLCDASIKSGVAQAITSIFPQVPPELVSFNLNSFKLNLTLKEVLQIAIACGNELQRLQVKPEESTEIAKLKAEIDRLTSMSN